ncbi:ATP-binding cassette domain-containing protein [Rhodococcus sp. NPDC057014]|uniref:ATP-binding cassette domain-containing protein n=1 Tax=Rhodococcus sp. NPDC057014 TaxID=3346000 RepID=UPI00363C2616
MRRGEVVGLVGENGAGESTLLNLLSGSETPDARQYGSPAGRPAASSSDFLRTSGTLAPAGALIREERGRGHHAGAVGVRPPDRLPNRPRIPVHPEGGESGEEMPTAIPVRRGIHAASFSRSPTLARPGMARGRGLASTTSAHRPSNRCPPPGDPHALPPLRSALIQRDGSQLRTHPQGRGAGMRQQSRTTPTRYRGQGHVLAQTSCRRVSLLPPLQRGRPGSGGTSALRSCRNAAADPATCSVPLNNATLRDDQLDRPEPRCMQQQKWNSDRNTERGHHTTRCPRSRWLPESNALSCGATTISDDGE